MNRLWVRLSLTYAAFYLIVISMLFFVPSLVSLYLHVMTKETQPMNSAVETEGSPEMAAEGMMVSVAEQLRAMSMELARASVIGGVIGIGAGIWTSRRLSKPITQLAVAAEAVSQRQFEHRVRDVTWGKELVTLTEAFNKMAAELDEAEKLRRQLITDVAHELRTPLTVLAGNLNAALDRVYELSEEEFANLYSQTAHLIRLVNDLHELAQAEAKQLPLNIKPTNVNQIVTETTAIFEVVAEEQAVALCCDLPERPILINVDGARLRQILHNLFSNALVHISGGGTIAIEVHPWTDSLQLLVRDDGEGIDPAQLTHIFDRFYRGDRSRSRETGGTGLGLAIVKAIVEAHGGTILAHSDGRGLGSIFTITLPTNLPTTQTEEELIR